ncbi:hypothetical protein [Ichthyobacterium seriolicida]|uniref:Lipoprotein n=1 Tax=Ichthyobacterium seriolicida TaxID=242600 RepID=A0A1J1E5Y3_9FLAO|nr:hypothetical protein [Ichthyobacterium seriolicida]BAV94734.1 hypothetical protein JBKA6_0721 [Ichthyobacterium seriolicida]
MKTLKIKILLLSILFTVISCKEDIPGNNDQPNNESKKYDLKGDITKNTTLKGGITYTLIGGVKVKDGVTVTIEPGTIIKSHPTEPSVAFLLFERGSKIKAKGTKEKPIVFTSGKTDKKAGDWGGVILCGKAPINMGKEATSEVANVTYGGNVNDDNSGIMEYVRIEYTGNIINESKEHNGLTLNGVGSGTTIDYVQVYKGKDDGFEFFGGTVNASHLVSTDCKDDSFDWTYGWVGKGQFWLAKQGSNNGDRGIEGDNDSRNNDSTPYSAPVLSNISLHGSKKSGDSGSMGLKLRAGTKVKIYNAVVEGFSKLGDIQHDQTIANLNDGSLLIQNSIFRNNTTNTFAYLNNDRTPANPSDGKAINHDDNNNTYSNNNSKTYDITTKAKSISQEDAWFDNVNYIGAFSEAERGTNGKNDWTTGWTK